MKTILLALLVAAFALPASDALAKRKHVRIYKPSPPICNTPGCDQWSRGNVPLVAVPPIAVAFDLARRTSCDPRLQVGGGAGYDPGGPAVGNFLVPAVYRSQCNGARPKWYGW